MVIARHGDRVLVHYTGRLRDGTIFETSQGRDPVELVAGSKVLIPPVSQALPGMAEGESKRVETTGEEAYGPHEDELVVEVPLEGLPAGMEPGQPMKLELTRGRVVFYLLELREDTAVLDANHPLSSEPQLSFEIELIEVNPGTSGNLVQEPGRLHREPSMTRRGSHLR